MLAKKQDNDAHAHKSLIVMKTVHDLGLSSFSGISQGIMKTVLNIMNFSSIYRSYNVIMIVSQKSWTSGGNTNNPFQHMGPYCSVRATLMFY